MTAIFAKALLILAAFVPAGFADSIQYDQVCAYACAEATSYIIFNTTEVSEDYYLGYCTDTLKWESAWACAAMHCSGDEIAAAEKYVEDMCEENGHSLVMTYDKFKAMYDYDKIKAMPVVNSEDTVPPAIFNNSVLLSEPFWEASQRTIVSISRVKQALDCFGADHPSTSIFGFAPSSPTIFLGMFHHPISG